MVDTETDNWPVSPDFQDDLDALKYNFSAQPLQVYVGNKFIELTDVNDTIRDALVEVHFELRHFYISSEAYDSFNATIEQIIVLQPGATRPNSLYKRKNVCTGPIRLNPAFAHQEQTHINSSVASSS
ncbi:hypothetical protein EI94DRAFT_1806762 [Lactarius quietus]|nr:hypothetical protein EI94DRAFT_1806762 [Lactarius quietus]